MFGPHLMLDLYGCDRKIIGDLEHISRLLDVMPGKIGMTKISEPHVLHYPGKKESFDKGGITGFVFLAESHISVHTFVREGFASVDVFSCKNFDMDTAEKFLMDAFKASKSERNVVHRGKDFVKAYP